MKLIKVFGSSIFQIISIVFVIGYLLGALNLHFTDKSNYCLMTYMFEFPQFVAISVPENRIFPQYGLYAYSEGRLTERARKMWFDGVPVLYLPGNSGSHMQARSLASVALRKALDSGNEYHFDYFTISYNEELSALYGGVLQDQTEFASACISRILSLYKSNRYTKNVPTSVILIGHSMGGLIVKRLLAYPSTLNTTSIGITLAAPLQAPVINFDMAMNDYYKLIDIEWEQNVNREPEVKQKKFLLSFGSGPKDILVPSWLTSSNESFISALTSAVPGVWVTTDHLSIVWCKQLVMAINKFLFSIIDPWTAQIKEDNQILSSKAKEYFQANRSMFLSPDINRPNVTMIMDAFWYEDNRRIYQISRPEINKATYLMIRLINFPQNRFVAIESINMTNKDWIFGCNAKYTASNYRYCKYGTSLTELSRWTGAANGFGKRKLATVHLHTIKKQHPDWSHVVVKVSPTRRPVTLNVDINDHASREITVSLPSIFSFGKSVVKAETEQDSLYYELLLPDFNTLDQAYLLYVEPTPSCKAIQYHVSAEMHVPWAKNHEYYHYFTQLKQTPMKLRLFQSNPNVTVGSESTQHVKITLLLDPQCTYTISISSSWYHRLAQLARNYTPVLVPYIAAIVLLAARSSILHLREHGTCLSIHGALMSEGVKPYYALVFARFGAVALMSVPFLSFILENASWNNQELQYFTRSLIVLPAYMTALGVLNIAVAAMILIMVFSSQLAHRLLFRIVWRGSSGFAERVASGLQKIPILVTVTLVAAVPLSCGAAALVAGAAFYAFMLSKMYEEYLEDYVYKFMAKVMSKICRIFKSKNRDDKSTSKITNSTESAALLPATEDEKENPNVETDGEENIKNEPKEIESAEQNHKVVSVLESIEKQDEGNSSINTDQNIDEDVINKVDEDLNNIHFHMMLFLLWISVTMVNVPALLTWARNFKYTMVLKPDTSYHAGLILSLCSGVVWQLNGPRKKLKYYDAVSALLFTMAVCVLALGPLSLMVVNYGVTFMFVVITIQQLFDKEEPVDSASLTNEFEKQTNETANEIPSESNTQSDGNAEHSSSSETPNTDTPGEDCDICSESRIYNVFKNLREKITLNEDL
ncbi:GPI inositol-deacylase [Achroia grisella]|uniref:GPI inositol-deacylase n=1 Tax=Achroia grisella TaxID=688607 RepID=UPI0027D2655C|nr:GPI inositol-deacylase [Achroia grisella]